MKIIILLSLTVRYYTYLTIELYLGANQDILNFGYEGLRFIHNICIIT